MVEEIKKLRDVEESAPKPTEVPQTKKEIEAIEEGAEKEEGKEETKPKTWIENFNVKECEDVETIDRLTVKVGINEYKGQMLVFMAKVTDKEFSRQFFSMPAYVWEKAIPRLLKLTPKIADVEKAVMTDAVTKELQRLKDLGVDISTLLKSVQGSPKTP